MNFRKNNRSIYFILCTLLILILSISGCADKTVEESPPGIEEQQPLDDSAIFKQLLDELFIETLKVSPLNASLSVGSLDDYGLGYLNSQLDNMSDDYIYNSYDNVKTIISKLNAIDKNKLTEEDQLTLEILKYYYELDIEGKEYYQHHYELQHTLGIHISLPLTLTQIPIESKKDADNYLTRLTLFPTAFSQLVESQKEQADKGLLPPEYILDKVLEQCESFMTAPEDNMLYLTFIDNINGLDNISDETKTPLTNKCIENINQYVYPAYSTLIEGIKEFKGKSTINTSVSELPNGTEYYEYLVKYHTGMDITPDEVYEWATDSLANAVTKSQILIGKNPELLEATDDIINVTYEDLDALYNVCYTILDENFIDYNIPQIKNKTIPTYLEKDLPAAFYLPISIDMKKYGNMFLQQSAYNDLDIESFMSVAHEAIPGHHFQFCVAYQQKDIPDIRKLLSFTCFSEGWASYTEGIAFDYIDYGNPQLIELQKYNLDAIYALQTVIDISIHYYGRTREDIVGQYTLYFGEAINDVVDRTIANPGEVLHYAYGRHIFNDLRNQAETELGNSFDIKEFHDVVLKNGEIPLYLLQDIVREYIDGKK